MQAQIQDYIKYFNQVVVVAMRQFMLTSSQLFQERVLFMLHQLLLLKVKFEPLDPQSVSGLSEYRVCLCVCIRYCWSV